MRIKPKNPKVLRARRIIVGGVALAAVLFVLLRPNSDGSLSMEESAPMPETAATPVPEAEDATGIRVKDLLTIASGQKFLPRGEACKYLTQVGLCAADYLDREVDTSLSGGEVKRIEIATILARQPQLMILDEPEAGIDLWSFARLTETFEEIHARQDCTMVIISHQERIISLADEILVIDKGEIARRGTRDEVFTDIVHSTTGGCPVIYGEAKK